MVAIAELTAAARRVAAEMPPILWMPIAINDAIALGNRLQAAIRSAAQRLATTFPRGVPVINGFDQGLFGTPWPGHGLHYPSLFVGFRPTEPQLMRALANLISPANHGQKARFRCRAFIAALFTAAGRPMPDGLSNDDQLAQLTVEAEHRIPQGQDAPRNRDHRIDLLVTWCGIDRLPRGVVVEVKFDAMVRKEQLPVMQTYVNEVLGGFERFPMFVLSQRRDRLAELDSNWVKVKWKDVLRHWETGLSGGADRDSDFARFRASLWLHARF